MTAFAPLLENSLKHTAFTRIETVDEKAQSMRSISRLWTDNHGLHKRSLIRYGVLVSLCNLESFFHRKNVCRLALLYHSNDCDLQLHLRRQFLVFDYFPSKNMIIAQEGLCLLGARDSIWTLNPWNGLIVQKCYGRLVVCKSGAKKQKQGAAPRIPNWFPWLYSIVGACNDTQEYLIYVAKIL